MALVCVVLESKILVLMHNFLNKYTVTTKFYNAGMLGKKKELLMIGHLFTYKVVFFPMTETPFSFSV